MATQTNTNSEHTAIQHAFFAIDGEVSESGKNISHTLANNMSWLQIDYGIPVMVQSVAIFTRKDEFDTMIAGSIYVGNNSAESGNMSSNEVCGSWDTSLGHAKGVILFTLCNRAISGKFLILQNTHHQLDSLQVNEVIINPNPLFFEGTKGNDNL